MWREAELKRTGKLEQTAMLQPRTLLSLFLISLLTLVLPKELLLATGRYCVVSQLSVLTHSISVARKPLLARRLLSTHSPGSRLQRCCGMDSPSPLPSGSSPLGRREGEPLCSLLFAAMVDQVFGSVHNARGNISLDISGKVSLSNKRGSHERRAAGIVAPSIFFLF